MSMLLEVRDLTLGFASQDGKRVTPSLDRVTFGIRRGETLGLVGESGCGKTVTMMTVMGLLPETAQIGGQIVFQEEDLLGLPEKARNSIRGARVGMVFQDPMRSLSPYYTVGNQLIEGMRHHLGMGKREAKERGLELLRKVGIPAPERVFDEYPSQLSGGMRQRVMIAIAISCEPDLLIADEPTTALDVTTQAQILELLRTLQQENGMAMILISHDLGVIAEMCSRILVMYAGQVIEESPTSALFKGATHPYTRALLAATPQLSGKQTRFYQIPGQVPLPGEWGTGCRFASRCEHASAQCASLPSLQMTADGRSVRCWHPHLETETQAREVRQA
jgi:peptide/nickel transport system ATP-binding protein